MTRKKTQKKTDINTSENLISEDFFPKGIKIEEDKVFPMAVIATMSSGKSTLINALIGKEILPSANAACTALNYSILDDDHDTKEVICVTKKDGNVTVIDENLSEELEKINQDPLVTDVFIRSHVKGVLNTDKALLIIDTPGPNNSADKTHEKRLYQILDKISGGLFVYVINASQIGIEDDEKLLKILAPYLRKNQTIKILFVMNKIDVLDREKESIEECVQNVRRYLQNCGFENPNIIPISAVAALLFKKVLNHEKLTRKQYRDFIELYDMYQSNDYNMKKYAVIDDLEDPFKEIEVRGEIYKTGELNVALENTGIKLLEEKIQKAQILSGEQLKNTIKVMEKREHPIKKRVFEVSVIATMSSGKSTLINALLQQELLPSENKACTAQITRIIDHDGMNKFEGVCYGEDNKTIIYPKSEITLDKMRKYNEDEKVKYIDLKGDIPEIPSDKIQLCLRDTPGPNLQYEEYRMLINNVIKRKNNIILYVMNVVQMRIDDDKILLKSIAQEMNLGGKEARDRFIFVLNKCDELDEEQGETVDQKINEAKDYLKEFEIIDPMIIPTYAQLALIIQKARNGDKLTRKEKTKYGDIEYYIDETELHYEEYATITPSVKAELTKKLDNYKKENDDELQAMIHTGVSVVEETIREYIEKYAYPMKIHDAVEDVISVIKNLDMDAGLIKTIQEDENKRKEFVQDIEKTEKLIGNTTNIGEDFAQKINSFVEDTFNGITRPDVDKDVEATIAKTLLQFNGQDEVDKVWADNVIRDFMNKLYGLQKDIESRLTRQIDRKIYQRGNALLEQYREKVESILSNISITGYDFKKVYSLKQFEIKNLNDIKRRNTKTRYRDETRYKDNPEREGFFGFFKFWKPKRISYTVSVEDGKNVKVAPVLVSIVTEFENATKENIEDVFNQAEMQVEEYKNIFIDNLDGLGKELNNTIAKLKEIKDQKANNDQEIKKNEELLNWIKGIEDQMNRVLEF